MHPQVSFKHVHNFSISGCNFGEVGGNFINGSELLAARPRRHSRGKSQKHTRPPTPHSLPNLSPPIATSDADLRDSQSWESGHDADISESEFASSTTPYRPHQASCFECNARRPGSMSIRNSVQTGPPPIELPPYSPEPLRVYSLDPFSDGDLRRRGKGLSTAPNHSLVPSISVIPPSHYPPRPPQSVQPQASNTDPRSWLIARPPQVYPGRAIRQNVMPTQIVRGTVPHGMLHRGTCPSNIVDVSWDQDARGSNDRRPLRRRSRF